MPTFEDGPVTIRYEEAGAGFPMLAIPGGGLNGRIEVMGHAGSFDPLVEFADNYRVVAIDPRNSPNGQTRGPLEPEKGWDQFTDDQLALMDHLGIDKFVVVGFCIGGPMIWNLLRRAPDRVVAAILAHPSGLRPEMPDLFYDRNLADWAPKAMEGRDDITQDMVETFLHTMYRKNADFVFTVDRDFARNCQTPLLIMPDDVAAHPYACAMESARLAPNAEVCLFPWREPEGGVALALRHARTFLKAHTPA
jgi:pimeloyl-ACP methyl ester carboxylesterase